MQPEQGNCWSEEPSISIKAGRAAASPEAVELPFGRRSSIIAVPIYGYQAMKKAVGCSFCDANGFLTDGFRILFFLVFLQDLIQKVQSIQYGCLIFFT